MSRGLFLVLEGGEGSGKSTQVGRLKAFVQANHPGQPFLFTREPGGSPLANQIRAVMIGSEAEDASGRTMLGLIMASRSDHVENTILPAIGAGKVVVSERYLPSSFAYQITAQESPELEDIFWAYHARLPRPDHTIFLDVDPATGLKRAAAREGGSNFHARPLAFHERVRKGYQTYFKSTGESATAIDANQDVEAVWRDLQKVVESVLTTTMV